MGERAIAAEARDLVKDFDGKRAVDGVSLTVPEGSITGILGPNGAGKTTGHPHDARHHRPDLGHPQPCSAMTGRSKWRGQVGYLPEERGLYPAMPAAEAIAFMGALRGLPIGEGRRRAIELLKDAWSRGLGETADPHPVEGHGPDRPAARHHHPRALASSCSTSPSPGLDAINQQKLEQLIRDQAAAGVTVIFSTHVIAHAERLCERVAIIAEGKAVFEGEVDEARGRLRPIVHLRTRVRGWAMASSSSCVCQADRRRVAVRTARQRPGAIAQGADRRRRRDRDAEHRTARPA